MSPVDMFFRYAGSAFGGRSLGEEENVTSGVVAAVVVAAMGLVERLEDVFVFVRVEVGRVERPIRASRAGNWCRTGDPLRASIVID